MTKHLLLQPLPELMPGMLLGTKAGIGESSRHTYHSKFYILNIPDTAAAQRLGLEHLEIGSDRGSRPVQASYTGTIQNELAKVWVRPGVPTLDALAHQEPAPIENTMKQYREEKPGPLAGGGMGSHDIMPLMSLKTATGDDIGLKRLIES